MYKIESNIPITKKETYPFSKMKVGDSFLEPNKSRRAALATAANMYVSRFEPTWKFSTKKCGGGYRCWRIK